VAALGHCHPAVVEALTRQANTLWHLGNGYTNEPVLRLALALTEATFADRAFFCNSGAEANEAALKLARKYAHTKFGAHKSRIISCYQSFHGRTLFTVSVGGQSKYTEGFEPLPPSIDHITYNDIEAARAAIGDDVCAVIVEPLQGEGGVVPGDRPSCKSCATCAQDRRPADLRRSAVRHGPYRRAVPLHELRHHPGHPDLGQGAGQRLPGGAMLTTHELAQTLASARTAPPTAATRWPPPWR
jgi:acetylornithine/N-succinyldiaminopimelate aminotransferase/succinylornithine aminotransferase